jgi:AcrR family transcriptional regulator
MEGCCIVIAQTHARKTTPLRKTKRSAGDRLASALTELVAGIGQVHPRPVPSVAELCRIANVSRNSLYRYHPEILQRLREHQAKQRPRHAVLNRTRVAALRSENAMLRKQIDSIAALADHYHGAYRETLTLLVRRDRELAELRRTLSARPVSITR